MEGTHRRQHIKTLFRKRQHIWPTVPKIGRLPSYLTMTAMSYLHVACRPIPLNLPTQLRQPQIDTPLQHCRQRHESHET